MVRWIFIRKVLCLQLGLPLFGLDWFTVLYLQRQNVSTSSIKTTYATDVFDEIKNTYTFLVNEFNLSPYKL